MHTVSNVILREIIPEIVVDLDGSYLLIKYFTYTVENSKESWNKNHSLLMQDSCTPSFRFEISDSFESLKLTSRHLNMNSNAKSWENWNNNKLP